jgi:quinone-modifying oxidoreductase subunit QmoC
MPKLARFDQGFAKEVYSTVESGEKIKMCMQCGVCAGSCPLGEQMDYTPRRIFALIRAGEREKVLNSRAIWFCTSCYNCKVRCPRKVPVVDVMHGLARKAFLEGYAEKQNFATFAKFFWENIARLGRIDEKDLAQKFFLSFGLVKGALKALDMGDVAIGMLLHKRMALLPGKPIKGAAALRELLDGACQLAKGEKAAAEKEVA